MIRITAKSKELARTALSRQNEIKSLAAGLVREHGLARRPDQAESSKIAARMRQSVPNCKCNSQVERARLMWRGSHGDEHGSAGVQLKRAGGMATIAAKKNSAAGGTTVLWHRSMSDFQAGAKKIFHVGFSTFLRRKKRVRDFTLRVRDLAGGVR